MRSSSGTPLFVLTTFLSVIIISPSTWAARIVEHQEPAYTATTSNGIFQPWNDPSQFLLGNKYNHFTISSIPTTRNYDWTISQQDIAPDGLVRPMLLVNGMFPGPLVEANTGDRIVVKVTNHLTVGTALHWHGMFQNGK